MTREEFDSYCRSFKAATNVVQWGNASVWKVGGKIFAIHSVWGEGDGGKISFKCSDLGYEVLKERPGLVPAPYLARAKWIQVAEPGAMSAEELRADIAAAYQIVARKLTRAKRAELSIVLE
ncbi:MAG: MmcQ/YjbR family DNA-binding protein [Hyphomicrobiales bacterium]|nr:MmcQ/YjbR family DNA-binding protein [Hyphomicrobiales bacterium]